jgi:hypothetical protein
VTLIGVTAIDCSNRTSALLKDLRPGEYQFLGIINPYIESLQKSLIVTYIGKISNIKPYVPLLDLSENISWLSLAVHFRCD